MRMDIRRDDNLPFTSLFVSRARANLSNVFALSRNRDRNARMSSKRGGISAKCLPQAPLRIPEYKSVPATKIVMQRGVGR